MELACIFCLIGVNINVLDRLLLIVKLLQRLIVDMKFVVNTNTYPEYYILLDGIYLQWSIFVQTIHEP
jgi:hypothetical protein